MKNFTHDEEKFLQLMGILGVKLITIFKDTNFLERMKKQDVTNLLVNDVLNHKYVDDFCFAVTDLHHLMTQMALDEIYQSQIERNDKDKNGRT